MEYPDLHTLTLTAQRDDALAALEVVELALSNIRAYLAYIEPFAPAHLLREHARTRQDVDFAYDICENVNA